MAWKVIRLYYIFQTWGKSGVVYCEKLLAVTDSTRFNPLQPPREHRNYVQRFTRHSRWFFSDWQIEFSTRASKRLTRNRPCFEHFRFDLSAFAPFPSFSLFFSFWWPFHIYSPSRNVGSHSRIKLESGLEIEWIPLSRCSKWNRLIVGQTSGIWKATSHNYHLMALCNSPNVAEYFSRFLDL